MPENWTPDHIASYQKYWDAYFDGDLGRRRRAKFVPGGVAKTFVQTREPELKGPFDEWLARIICFAFSISPQALTAQMNRATAETQKELAEEEGLTPVLSWVKALINDVIADEFDSPDLEFSWSNEASIDPQAQESILTSYATKGILTINEARVALGREPLLDAAANKPMVLTGKGYVPLGQEPPAKRLGEHPKARQRRGHVSRFNPYHDERGRFTTADGAGAATAQPASGRVQVASNDVHTPVHVAAAEPPEVPEDSEGENRAGEQNNQGRDDKRGGRAAPVDRFARQQIERLNAAMETLSALDPQRSSGYYVAAPDYVPTDQDIANVNAEIGRVAAQRITNFAAPDGKPIGTRGGPDVRNLPGGEKAAQEAFDCLRVGGTPYKGAYPGTMVTFPNESAWVGLRTNKQGIPTIDIRVPGSSFGSIRFHYR